MCQAVKVGAARLPRQVTQCNCAVCRRYGTLWPYDRRAAVAIRAARGAIESYSIPSARERTVVVKSRRLAR